MLKTASTAQMELDEEYNVFEATVANRIKEVSAKPLFTTDVDPADLGSANGLMLSDRANSSKITLRVKTGAGVGTYQIDRLG